MQPLATEAGPRSVCAHCGEPLPAPNGSATFVYGVGAVGYQSCAACGAKWRYLWQDPPAARVKPDRGRRLVLVLGAVALAVLLVVGAIAVAQSQPWNRTDEPAAPTTSSAPAGTTRSPDAPTAFAIAVEYNAIAGPMKKERDDFMTWLVGSATATPQYDVNERTKAYVNRARTAIRMLEDKSWAAEVAGEIDVFVDRAQRLLDDLGPVLAGQAGSPSYITMITDEAGAVDAADQAVQEKLVAQASE